MTTIAKLMTREPVTVRPSDSVQYAAQLMDELNVGALPVCDGFEVLGIVTDRDITVRATAAGLDPARTTVHLVMSERVRCCLYSQRAADVLRRMATVQIRRMPVLDDAERLIGIVSIGDMAARQLPGVTDTLARISDPAAPDRSLLTT